MKRAYVVGIVALLLATPVSAWDKREALLVELGYSATPENIEDVVVGKSCVSSDGDVVMFGATGVFEHAGHQTATYRVGYAGLIIIREGETHSHIVTVAPKERVLHFSRGKYQC